MIAELDPFAVLGPHVETDVRGSGVAIRTMQPAAQTVHVRLLPDDELHAMARVDAAGLFELRLKADRPHEAGAIPDYRLRITFPGDHVVELDDPYRYGRVLTDFDLYLLGEG